MVFYGVEAKSSITRELIGIASVNPHANGETTPPLQAAIVGAMLDPF